MPEHDGVDSPTAWLSAEQAAVELIVRTAGFTLPGRFEVRVTRDVLALTLLLAGVVEQVRQNPTAALERMQQHLADETTWQRWCQSRLYHPASKLPTSDLVAARARLRWLAGSRLLTTQSHGKTASAAKAGSTAVGWRPGLDLEPARLVVKSALA